jgi:hypothetical protein
MMLGLCVSSIAFNFYSPWFLGTDLSASAQALGPGAIGLVTYWAVLQWTLGSLHEEARRYSPGVDSSDVSMIIRRA